MGGGGGGGGIETGLGLWRMCRCGQLYTIFLGVARHHPSASLQFMKWVYCHRSGRPLRELLIFLLQLMGMNNDRLAKEVMLETLEMGSKV